VVSAISGAGGLLPTLWAIQAGKTIALANKESLVMAGALIMREARKNKAEIRPVDSEHSAIFQATHCGKPAEIRQVILTASGGPFYYFPRHRLHTVRIKQALNHPTYRMGPKITIDSATLMNKALEVIEAKYLFGLAPRQIKVLIHPQSIVHSMVEFRDGSTIAQLSQPDMRVPIQFALTYPDRLPQPASFNNTLLKQFLTLSFEEPDTTKFPALKLGYEVLRRGGTAGAVLNAANEEAVKLFLTGQIHFTDITALTSRVLKQHQVITNPSLSDILTADRWARLVVSPTKAGRI
jgi:1-deoxy-D-xylulose-5-phosphate reductoisomerase